MKDLHNENYKTFLKEDVNERKHIKCLWIGRNNIAKKSILLKAICIFNAGPIKIIFFFLAEVETS